MPALLINLRIDSREKAEFFKVTLADIRGLFGEFHVKLRGPLAAECSEFARECLGPASRHYQALREDDWVAATLQIIANVEARSVFLFFEDHRIVCSPEYLRNTLFSFDEHELDYMCYSFFRASKLEHRNLLPLRPKAHEAFSEFRLDEANCALLGRLSPNYYTFSLMSLSSVEYFRAVLTVENKRFKIHSRYLVALLTRAFRYPGYRKVLASINSIAARFGVTFTIYEPSSPFNLERLWNATVYGGGRAWKFGVPRRELFANYDDDNSAYGESLIKRGRYPFRAENIDPAGIAARRGVAYPVELDAGASLDCTYHSHNARIRQAPVVEISVTDGTVDVDYQGMLRRLRAGESRCFYSNLSPVIRCDAPAKVLLKVVDEVFD